MSDSLARSRSTTGILTQVILFVTAASLASVLIACGGQGEPPVRLLLEADLSELPPEATEDEAMTALLETLEGRAEAFGSLDAEIEREDSSRVSVTLEGAISEEDARQIMVKTATLELRQPVLDESGDVVCQSPDAGQFSVSAEDITYTTEAPGDRPAPRCLGDQGQSGEIVWEPAAADDQYQTQDTPPVAIQPLSTTVDRTREPVVVITLAPVHADLLQATSERLVGLPLGFFLDEELLAGPTIQEPLTDNRVPIAGLSLNEANILAAQLNAGALPVPVEEISSEGAPE